MEIKSYRDLRVWQSGMDLVVMVKKTRWLSSPECSLRDVSKPPMDEENHVTKVLHLTCWFRYGSGRTSPPTRPTEYLLSLGKQLYALRNALQPRNQNDI